MIRSWLRRVAAAAAVVLAVLVMAASPAGADPAKPGDYRSTVTSVQPPTQAVTAKVVGGDGFLEIHVQPGHDVIVQGYYGGPWLHIRPDGVVEENQLSPATYLNANRYGTNPAPDGVDATSETQKPPQYKQVATGGTYAWHDHRIHWMSPQPPSNATRGEIVPGFEDWKVAMTVDGTPTTVHGQLVYASDVSPLPWIAIGVIALIGVVVLGKGKSTLVAAIATVVAALAALFAGIVAYRSIPPIAGPNPLEIVLPAVGTVTAVIGLLLHRKPFGVIAVLASVASLIGWAIMRITVLFNPILPTDAPFWFDRLATTLAIALPVGAAILAVRSGALVLHLPDLDLGDDEDEPVLPRASTINSQG